MIASTAPRTSSRPASAKHNGTHVDPLRYCDTELGVLPPELLIGRQEFLALGRRCGLYERAKRAADISIAILALLLTLPLWAIAICGILIADGRPVFFVQPRVGRSGKLFRIVKFRTLRTNRAASHTPTDGIASRQFAFGTFLRRTRIDELPQLLNVVAGQMSLVGPRPEMIYYHRRSAKSIPCYSHRLSVTPGLSGWAQINYAHSTTDEEYREKTAFDLWYVAHRSLLLDARIALRTMWVLIKRFGAK